MTAPDGRPTPRLDAMEANLARVARRLSSGWPHFAAVAALVLLAVAVRLPTSVHATEVVTGHNDAWIYFNQAWADYGGGWLHPDAHRASGWTLTMHATFEAFGLEGGTWSDKWVPVDGEKAEAAQLAHVLSAMFSAGIVAATYLLARQLLPASATLGVLVLMVFDPYLLFTSPGAMSEPPYTVLFVLAIATVLKARANKAWLLATGLLMAGAHFYRINGLVMFAMAMLFAAVLLAPAGGWWAARRRVRELARDRAMWRLAAAAAGAVLLFLLALSPYLAWRAEHLPGPFDYGTNQRFWADDLWDMDDRYWRELDVKEGGPKETFSDYAANHTVGDALARLGTSIQWQVFDLTGAGKWPPLQKEGGSWPGTPPDGAAMTPMLVALCAVAAFNVRGRAWAFVPLALGVTFLTFLWVYPLVRSVRYFAPLLPLLACFGAAGYVQAAGRMRRPLLVACAGLALFVGLYGTRLLLAAPDATVEALTTLRVRGLVAGFALLWVGLALAPVWARRRGRAVAPAPA